MTTATRRELRFDSLDDVVRDAEALLAKGYDKAGNWDLAQVCGHLADWLTYPVAGFPKAPLPIRVMLRLVRATLGRKMFEKYLREGMPAGKPTMPQSVHPAGGDPVAAVAPLREAARTFQAHPGEYLPSPLFGRLDRGDATRLQLAHAAHHLSFLIPRQA
jgi:hypothetical protein